MNLTLQPDEAAILKDVLQTYLSDLRAEVGKTEDYETKQTLKQREAVLNTVIAQLGR